MKRSELLSRILILTGSLLAIGAPLFFWGRTPLIHGQMAENGGWTPDVLRAEVGEPLTLHLTSDDVMHGFAVGQTELEAVDVQPGKVADITLTFDKAGTYTFYCTRWCGVNHWRMRGTIEVSGPNTGPQSTPKIPLYVALGINIDAPHESPAVPDARPSAIRGQKFAANMEISAFDLDFYRTNSPYQTFEALSATDLGEAEKWDVVAYLWSLNTTATALSNGKQLYTQNCAACHGENGAGNGVFADEIADAGQSSMQTMIGAENSMMQTPANFTEPGRMFGASPALLQGKILRGGMGTGMPMWGSIFTEKQIWDLVAYLYSFHFEYEH